MSLKKGLHSIMSIFQDLLFEDMEAELNKKEQTLDNKMQSQFFPYGLGVVLQEKGIMSLSDMKRAADIAALCSKSLMELMKLMNDSLQDVLITKERVEAVKRNIQWMFDNGISLSSADDLPKVSKEHLMQSLDEMVNEGQD